MSTYFGQVTGGALNLRSAASTSASRLALIPNGTEILVSDYSGSAAWLGAVYANKDGFVMRQYVTNLRPVPERTGTVRGGRLNLRASPSKSARVLLQIPDGTQIAYQEQTKEWLSTTYNKQSGFVMAEFVLPGDAAPEPPPATPEVPPDPPESPDAAGLRYVLVTANPDVNVRETPSAAGRILGHWQRNRIGVGEPLTANWFQSNWRGKTAHISTDFLNDLGPAAASIPTRMVRIGDNEMGITDAQAVRYYGSPSVDAGWCQIFANFIALLAGSPAAATPTTASTPQGILFHVKDKNRFWFKTEAHKKNMRAYSSVIAGLTTPTLTQEETAYVPRVGDFVYYCWNNSGDHCSHVGLVYSVQAAAGTFTAIEGNKNNKVGLRLNTPFRDNKQLVGFGRLAY